MTADMNTPSGSRRCLWFLCAGVILSLVALLALVVGRASWTRRHYSQILAQLEDCQPRVVWKGGKPVEIYFHDPIANFNLDDEDIAILAELRSLRLFAVHFAPNLTDTGVAYLASFKELRALQLSSTQVTDAGLASLEDLTELRSLLVNGTQISDDGLVHLTRLSELRNLDLSNCPITNAGLPILLRIPRLEHIVVTCDGSRITEAALEGLERSRRELDVSYASPEVDESHMFSPPAETSPFNRNREGTEILLAEREQGPTFARLVCRVDDGVLRSAGIQPDEGPSYAPALLAAVRSDLPSRLVEWFEIPPGSETAPADPDRKAQIQMLLQHGVLIQLTAGCRNNAVTACRIMKTP